MTDVYTTPPPEPGTVRNLALGIQGEFDFPAEDDADQDFPTEVNDDDDEEDD